MSKFSDLLEEAVDAAKRFLKWVLPSSRNILTAVTSILNNLKDFDTNHPEVGNILTAIIPGDLDDKLLSIFRVKFPAILIKLNWAKNYIGLPEEEVEAKANEIVADGLIYIRSLEPELRAVAWQSLWQLLGNYLTEQGVSLSDLQKISQIWYETEEKKEISK